MRHKHPTVELISVNDDTGVSGSSALAIAGDHEAWTHWLKYKAHAQLSNLLLFFVSQNNDFLIFKSLLD